MKKIDRLVLKNFKAFRDQTFEFGGKNVLLYGNNGSGKSSLYWALYTFLQSSGKTDAQLQAYFQHFEEQNPDTFRSLKNVFAPTDQDVLVEMTYVADDGTKTIKTISPTLINTIGDTVLQKANLASDFINYKLLQNFYNVTHKQEVNLWEVFWRDVFPYFEENGRSYREQMENLELPTRRTQAAREQFQADLTTLNNQIEGFLGQIQDSANEFLKAHFYEGKDFLKLLLRYKVPINEGWVREKNDALENNKIPQGAEIKLWVNMYDAQTQQWIENHRPQSFLNEAQLTRIALAIRIGALRTRPHRENIDFRVLCLDDLLISLDMSNRHKVIKMLLNVDNNPALAFFDDYQKIILTHDKGFFNLLKRFTTATDWKYFELHRDENGQQAPVLHPQKSHFERAKEYFDESRFDDAALYLRKEIESILKRYFNTNLKAESQYETLSNLIAKAREQITEGHRRRFNKFTKTPLNYIQRLGTDFEFDTNLSPEEKQKLRGFKMAFVRLLEEQHSNQDEATWLIDRVNIIVDFNLNMNAHDSTHPNYQEEISEALDVVNRLRDYFEAI